MQVELKRLLVVLLRKDPQNRVRDVYFLDQHSRIRMVAAAIEVRTAAFWWNVDLHAIHRHRLNDLLLFEEHPEIDIKRKTLHDEHRRDIPIPSIAQRNSLALDMGVCPTPPADCNL